MSLIALSGFMASGKTFFGRNAAAMLGLPFIDLDEEITVRHGAPADVFAREGEDGFRRCESGTLAEVLASYGSGVLALGGGTVLSEDNVSLLRDAGAKVVWLDTSMDIIWSEIGNAARPLAAGRSREELEQLLQSRRPAYKKSADTIFVIDSTDYDKVSRDLASLIDTLL